MRAALIVLLVLVPIVATIALSQEVRTWLRGTGSIRQTLSNAGVGVLFLVTQLALRGAVVGAFAGVAALVPWKLSEHVWWSWPFAFVLLDFVYYVQHRLEHALPVLWAIHSVHHQSRDYNLSVSFRVGMLASVSTLFFHLSLALAGVTATMYAAIAAIHATLLFTLHARTKLTLGPGRFFNAPVFHRVHHGAEAAYIDKNFGGVFLVFDRILGTFAPYVEEPTYGVASQASPEGPVAANVAPFASLARTIRVESTLLGKVSALFVRKRRPGS